jgi:Glyoxalase-like domain
MTTHLPAARLDHLVVLAASLADGMRWCENALGITPGPGGEHALMGTHNRLSSIASPAFPLAYLEIIAINSGASYGRAMGENRWFDMDNTELQLQLEQTGPRLAHWVARTAQAQAALQAWTALGLDRGKVIEASRMTAQGPLDWKITVRDDGQRLFFGTLPTLIEWGHTHPARSMAPSGITLLALQAFHPRPEALRAAYQAIGLTGVDASQGPPNLVATLQTPQGVVVLESKGL